MFKKKYLIIGSIIILIIVVTIIIYRNSNNKNKFELVKYEKIERGKITVIVNATGVIEANYTIDVKSKASGEIINLPYEIGDYVEKGKLLLELDPSDEIRNLSKAEIEVQNAKTKVENAKSQLTIETLNYKNTLQNINSSLESAKINLENAEKKYKRQKELYDNNLSSLEQFENAKAEYISAKTRYDQLIADSENLKVYLEKINIRKLEITEAEAQLRKAEIALEEAKERKKETKIYAPISGVIVKKEVSAGQIISSGISNVGGGTLLFTIADLSKIYVITSIDESDIGKIKVGQLAFISVDAFSDKKFKGVVERISPQGEEKSSVTIFKIKINVTDEKKNLLKLGMSASIDILIDEKDDVLYVPISAIKEFRRKTFIIVKRGNKNERIPVKKGITDGTYIEIESKEIEEGEEVMVSNIEFGNKKNFSGSSQRRNRPMRFF
ncbi:MAG TPA: efflux RND transporter periplasmic adaptor subunit [bacterium]|nr:efflux RND transporter periplasmic adaptor subunit [bacterium]HOL47156.1 efflux RND transporter periplasmic adaptor subunit [bacterium]HPQ18079.1 efflux RND transporter periplasmic adaptor subunit [bacterium]